MLRIPPNILLRDIGEVPSAVLTDGTICYFCGCFLRQHKLLSVSIFLDRLRMSDSRDAVVITYVMNINILKGDRYEN